MVVDDQNPIKQEVFKAKALFPYNALLEKLLPITQKPILKHWILIHHMRSNREKMTDNCTTKLLIHQMLLYTH